MVVAVDAVESESTMGTDVTLVSEKVDELSEAPNSVLELSDSVEISFRLTEDVSSEASVANSSSNEKLS